MCPDGMQRHIFSLALRKSFARCQPLPAGSLSCVRHSDCDVVIMDSSIGLETDTTVEALRICNERCVPVLVVSSSEKIKGAWLSAGALAFLAKPFHHEQLCASLKNVVISQRSKSSFYTCSTSSRCEGSVQTDISYGSVQTDVSNNFKDAEEACETGMSQLDEPALAMETDAAMKEQSKT